MSFWINDRLKIAYEDVEGGVAIWNSKDKDFTSSMSLEDLRRLRPVIGSRLCTEDEARAYMLAKDEGKDPRES